MVARSGTRSDDRAVGLRAGDIRARAPWARAHLLPSAAGGVEAVGMLSMKVLGSPFRAPIAGPLSGAAQQAHGMCCVRAHSLSVPASHCGGRPDGGASAAGRSLSLAAKKAPAALRSRSAGARCAHAQAQGRERRWERGRGASACIGAVFLCASVAVYVGASVGASSACARGVGEFGGASARCVA